MNSRLGFGMVAAGALVALVSGSGFVEAREARDRIFMADGIELHRIGTVAILPAVSVRGDRAAEARAEFGWVALYGRGRTHWMPAVEVRRRMAGDPDATGDLVRLVRAQVWCHGAVDSQTAVRLCERLGVDGVLCLRVDRWERVECRGMVAMTATLSGADGQRLWSASGLAGHGRSELPDTDAEEHPDHHTCTAYYMLLARWAGQLPSPMQERELPSDLLALIHDE